MPQLGYNMGVLTLATWREEEKLAVPSSLHHMGSLFAEARRRLFWPRAVQARVEVKRRSGPNRSLLLSRDRCGCQTQTSLCDLLACSFPRLQRARSVCASPSSQTSPGYIPTKSPLHWDWGVWEWSLNDAARTSLGGEVGTWGVLEGVSGVEVIMETEADDSTERKRRLGKPASMRPQLWTNPELHEHKQDQVLEADTITK